MSVGGASKIELAWLAGILDGEGCFSVKRQMYRNRYGRHSGRMSLALWVVLCNTNEPMIRRAEQLFHQIGANPQPVRRVWKGKKATRWQYWLHVARKDSVLLLTQAVLPYLVAKRVEAEVFVWYLTRACRVRAYRPTALDKAVLASLADVKRNGGEAPAEVVELLREVIPSQALEGAVSLAAGSREGVETRGPSPNGNDPHECPAPAVQLRAVR